MIKQINIFLLLGANLIASTLETNNPFIPQGYENKIVVAKTNPKPSKVLSKLIEFRGLYTLENITKFSLHNKRENKAYWISQNQSKGGITVSSFNENSKTITINMNGYTESLRLAIASNTPLPVGFSNGLYQNPNVENRVPRRRVILP